MKVLLSKISFLETEGRDMGVNHPSTSGAKVKEKVELYIYSSVHSWQIIWLSLPLSVPYSYKHYIKKDAK
jgi:hypothetical protein